MSGRRSAGSYKGSARGFVSTRCSRPRSSPTPLVHRDCCCRRVSRTGRRGARPSPAPRVLTCLPFHLTAKPKATRPQPKRPPLALLYINTTLHACVALGSYAPPSPTLRRPRYDPSLHGAATTTYISRDGRKGPVFFLGCFSVSPFFACSYCTLGAASRSHRPRRLREGYSGTCIAHPNSGSECTYLSCTCLCLAARTGAQGLSSSIARSRLFVLRHFALRHPRLLASLRRT